jgi:cytochrome c biogenesis protein CcmG/thiol:disulfide interchange protein DsbE
MKSFLIDLVLIVIALSCKSEYYQFDDDRVYTKKEVRSRYEKSLETLPSEYLCVPTIYHRSEQGDSTINYIMFFAQRKNSGDDKNKFEFVFKQDPLYLLIDSKLPKFKLNDIDGNAFNSEALIGKPSLLNFWYTACSPCVAEFPDLNRLYERYADQMNFIAITDDHCSDESLKDFLELHPLDFKILIEGGHYMDQHHFRPIPKNVFVDRNGYIRYIKGAYPSSIGKGLPLNDEENYFVRIIEALIDQQ